MKNIFFLVLAMPLFFACQGKQEAEKPIPAPVVVKDSVMAGNDKDAHGCIGSAGYTWSELKQDCVRLFEVGTRLNPYENPVKEELSAFVVFDGDKAELFLPSEKESILLVRKSEGDSFTGGDWQLIPWKGYVLKKSGTILFTGQ